ncbi:MAG: hypothetical protein WA441_02360 [Methyloceanibacter sp.]
MAAPTHELKPKRHATERAKRIFRHGRGHRDGKAYDVTAESVTPNDEHVPDELPIRLVATE